MKKVLALLLTAVMIMTTGTLAFAEEEAADDVKVTGTVIADWSKVKTTDKPNEELTFGWAVHYTMDDWGRVSSEAFQERCDELGINCVVFNGENNAEKQLNDLRSMQTQEFDAIAINPLDTAAIAGIGEEFYEDGVPFFAVTVQEDYPVYGYVDGGQTSKAKAAADMMVEDMGGEGKIVLMTVPNLQNLMELRELGLTQAIEGTNMEVVDTKLANSADEFNTVTNDLITSGEEFDVIFTTNGAAATGVLSALEALGRKDIPVYGFEAEYVVLQMLKEGYGTGFACQFPSDTAVTLVDTMLAVLHGEEVGTDGDGIVIEPRIKEVATRDNCDEMAWECWRKELK